MASKAKIITVPVSDKITAEAAVNAALAEVPGTIINISSLEMNRIIIFYTESSRSAVEKADSSDEEVTG